MIETIICPLWVSNDKRFRSRHYNAWDRPCRSCGRKVIVSDAVKVQLDSNRAAVILCEQCAVIETRTSEIETPGESEPNAIGEAEPCATCATLKEQEESAAMELARCKDLPDRVRAETASKKWSHLFHARWDHHFKAHNSESRGRE
jgi:hypothetical protein